MGRKTKPRRRMVLHDIASSPTLGATPRGCQWEAAPGIVLEPDRG